MKSNEDAHFNEDVIVSLSGSFSQTADSRDALPPSQAAIIHGQADRPENSSSPENSKGRHTADDSGEEVSQYADDTVEPDLHVLLGNHIPAKKDSWSIFFKAVSTLLSVFKGKRDWSAFLLSLPQVTGQVSDPLPQHLVAHLCHGVRDFVSTPLHSGQAVALKLPLHLCSNYVLGVVLSSTTGLPHSFYEDVVTSLMSSILHKDVAVQLSGWCSRPRCWVAGTGEPGAAKSPCIDPIRDILMDVLHEVAHLAPGVPMDKFHVQEGTTNAVVLHRLRSADGCCLLGSGEVGPLLWPAWASQGKYINYQRLLDAASGGQVAWETMQDRPKKRRHVTPDDDEINKTVNRTNFTITMIHQLSIFRKWQAKVRKRQQRWIGVAFPNVVR